MAENIKAELRRLQRRKQLQYSMENSDGSSSGGENTESPSRSERALFTFKQVRIITRKARFIWFSQDPDAYVRHVRVIISLFYFSFLACFRLVWSVNVCSGNSSLKLEKNTTTCLRESSQNNTMPSLSSRTIKYIRTTARPHLAVSTRFIASCGWWEWKVERMSCGIADRRDFLTGM
mgnify:CR=1 FL=1